MDRINRRGFLGLAAGATAMTALSPSIARAAAIPADRRTGRSPTSSTSSS